MARPRKLPRPDEIITLSADAGTTAYVQLKAAYENLPRRRHYHYKRNIWRAISELATKLNQSSPAPYSADRRCEVWTEPLPSRTRPLHCVLVRDHPGEHFSGARGSW